MCTALRLNDKGSHTVLKERIMSHIKNEKLSQTDLWQMPAMAPGFTRKPAKRKGLRSRANSIVSMDPEDTAMVDDPAPTPLLTPIPGDLPPLTPFQQAVDAAYSAIPPETVTLHTLLAAFNESQVRQKNMEEVMHKVVASQNDVIQSVNIMGRAIHPVMKDTQELKQTMKMIKQTMQEMAEERYGIIVDYEQTTSDLVQEINDLTNKGIDNEALLEDIKYNLTETIDHAKALEAKTESGCNGRD